MLNEELKPCPFCGGDAKNYKEGFYAAYVTCLNCGVDMCATTEADAIERWNNRAPTQEAKHAE